MQADTLTGQGAQTAAAEANDSADVDLSMPLSEWVDSGEVLADKTTGGAKQTRVRLVKVDFKYPLIRVEETTTSSIAQGKPEPITETTAMVGDHVMVSLMDGVAPQDLEAAIAPEGFAVRRVLSPTTALVSFEITEGRDDLRYAEERLRDFSDIVAVVEPDYVFQAHALPPHPEYLETGRLWGLHNTGAGGVEGADIDAIVGWNIRARAPNTTIAIIDTGMRLTHEKLAPNLWVNVDEALDGTDTDGNGYIDDINGFDFYSYDADPSDLNGHGTHVAGIAGANADAEGGLVGVAWDVKLMALRFLGPKGYGVSSDAILCIDYARQNGARVLNNSWGGSGRSTLLEEAIERCAQDSCVFVASAGNSNRDIDVRPHYPAAYPTPNIVSVAATNRLDEPTFFTCRGFRKVDIAAPGQDILSAGHYTDTGLRRLSGTSMAAPFISGILALLDGEHPGSTSSELINRLYRGAETLDESYQHFWQTGARAGLPGALSTTTDRPPNDLKADAYPSNDSTWAAWEVDSASATFEASTAYARTVGSTGDIWFAYTAQGDGPVRISTEETATAIRFHVLSGSAQITSANGGETVYVDALDGQQFNIAVENLDAGGLVVLDITQPPVNDRRTDALTQEGLFWITEGENGGATLDFEELDQWGYAPIERNVWWKWEAPRDGRFVLSTEGSDFDTVLAVFREQEEFFLQPDSSHLIFAIDRSAFTADEYRTSPVYDANDSGTDNEIIDQQIAGVSLALRILRYYAQRRPPSYTNLKIGIVVFDDGAQFLDLDSTTPEIDQWAYLRDDIHDDDFDEIIEALRTITPSSSETIDLPNLLNVTQTELASEGGSLARMAIMTPGQGISDPDFSAAIAEFRASGGDFAFLAPGVSANLDLLSSIDLQTYSYANYREVIGILQEQVAVNDDATWHGLWSQVVFNAVQGKTYYFGVAGYLGEHGMITLNGRDPDFPYIISEPESITVDLGERAAFEVEVTGQEPLLFQWFKDGEPIAGAHGRSYSIWSSVAADMGEYHVEISNLHGRAISDSVKLQTNDIAPRFTFQPEASGFVVGEGLRLMTATVGTPPIAYQWFHDGAPVPGQTNAILSLPAADHDEEGEYYVVATNPLGETRSVSVHVSAVSNEFANWKLREGNPDQNKLWDVTFGDGIFVGVGDAGEVLSSVDATHWERAVLPAQTDLRAAAYGNGAYVIAGVGGAVYVANSPGYWEPLDLGVTEDWRGVDFIDGVFWLTGSNGAMALSKDGRHWEQIETGSTATLVGIAYGHDGFLAISDSAAYLTSTDGSNWEEKEAINGDTGHDANDEIFFRDVTYFDGKYYLANNGQVAQSSTTELAPLLIGSHNNFSYFSQPAKSNELLVVGGSSRYQFTFLYGKGGRGESGRYELFGGNPVPNACAYGLGFYVTVGNDGMILRSQDGIDWESGWSITQHMLYDIAYARGRYIATNRHGAIYASPDGVWWETVREKYWSGTSSNSQQTFIVEQGGYVYVVDPDGDHGRTPDGITWEWFTGHDRISSIITDGSRFFYARNSQVYESVDLHSDVEEVFPGESLSGPRVTYGDGVYLLLSAYVNRYSVNGDHWTDISLTGEPGSGMLVAQDSVFLSQAMNWSSDGVNWQRAGVMVRIPAENNELHYTVAENEIVNWSYGDNVLSGWTLAPDNTVFGYDTQGLLSAPINGAGNLEQSMHGQHSSFYIRYPLGAFYPDDYLSLELRARCNDGFLVSIRNQVVAGANAADTSAWDSLALSPRNVSESETEQIYDLTAHLPDLDYSNSKLVAIQVLNHDVSDGLLLFDFDLYGIKQLDLENVFAAGGSFFGFDAQGNLYVSENARDWVDFVPNTGVLNKIIQDPVGFTGVGENGSVYQTRDPERLAPKVYLRLPTNSQTVGIGDVVPLEAEAHAVDGIIDSVSFYANNQLITTLTEPPYTHQWETTTFGAYDLYAVATDSNGQQSVSDKVNLRVSAINPWSLTSSAGSPDDMNALEWINGKWLAPADAGRLYASADGVTWKLQNLPTSEDLLSIASAPDGALVVGGRDGGIFASYDGGRNWVEEDRFKDHPLDTLIYAFGRFYFASYSKVIVSSPDYQDWTIQREFYPGAGPAAGFAFGNGKLMLAWWGELFETTDGEQWTQRSLSSLIVGADLKDLDFYDGSFYLSYRFEYNNYEYTPGYFIDTEAIAIAKFDDSSDTTVYQAIYGDSLSVVSGVQQVRARERLHFDQNGHGLFLGSVTALYDPTADVWTTAESSTINDTAGFGESHAPASYLTSHNGEFWIIHGERPLSNTPVVPDEGRPLKSTDGVVWLDTNEGVSQNWANVKVVNAVYCSIGNGGMVFHSTDSQNWTRSWTGGAHRLRDIAYGAGTYVVVGNNGFVATSPDLIDWKVVQLGVSGDLHTVTFANGQFVLGGFDAVFRSANGLAWENVTPDYSQTEYGFQITQARFVDGKWLLAGALNDMYFVGRISPRFALLLVSTNNAASWSEVSTLPDFNPSYVSYLNDVRYFNGEYVLTGAGRVDGKSLECWRSVDLISWTGIDDTYTNTAQRMVVDGGELYMVETRSLHRTTDMTNWETLIDSVEFTAGPAIGPAGLLVVVDGKIKRLEASGALVESMGSGNSLDISFATVIGDEFWIIDGQYRVSSITPDGERTLRHPGGQVVNRIEYLNGRYFIYSDRYASQPLTSTDGINWTTIPYSEFEEVPAQVSNPEPVIFLHDGTEFYCIVERGGGGGITRYICKSPDGLNWEFVDYTSYENATYMARDGLFYRFSRSVAMQSADLINWEVLLIGDNNNSNLGEANGTLFFNQFYTEDWENWSPLSGMAWAFDIVYSHGVYLALNSVFEAGNVSMSEDRATWSQASTLGINPMKLIATDDGFAGLTDTGSIYSFSLNDLAATNVQWEQSQYGALDEASGVITLVNAGKLPWSVDDVVTIELWLSGSGRLFDRSSKVASTMTWQGDLAPGESVVVPVTMVIPEVLDGGRYYTGVVVDPLSDIPDYNRANNEFLTLNPDILIPEWSVVFQSGGGGAILSQNPGAQNFTHNSEETFLPVAHKGYVFSGWANQEDPGLGPLTLTFNQNHSVEANFDLANRIEITTSGLGSVSQSAPGEFIAAGTAVSLQATPKPGWRFEKWTGSIQDTANPLNLTLHDDLVLRAQFIPDGQELFTSWASTYASPSAQNPNDDGIGNGRANLLDYFFGLDTAVEYVEPRLRAVQGGYEFLIPINLESQGVGFEVRYGATLDDWRTLPGPSELIQIDGRDYLRYRIENPGRQSYFFIVEVYEVE